MMAPPRRCQGIKCPRTGAGARARGALERGGPRSRAERTLERGGACSREAHPLERDGARPREARILERGGACSRGSSSGPPWWAVSCMVRRVWLSCGVFNWGFPCCLRGPLGLSPTQLMTIKFTTPSSKHNYDKVASSFSTHDHKVHNTK
jgi:hypothetical protein